MTEYELRMGTAVVVTVWSFVSLLSAALGAWVYSYGGLNAVLLWLGVMSLYVVGRSVYLFHRARKVKP